MRINFLICYVIVRRDAHWCEIDVVLRSEQEDGTVVAVLDCVDREEDSLAIIIKTMSELNPILGTNPLSRCGTNFHFSLDKQQLVVRSGTVQHDKNRFSERQPEP